MTVLIYIRLCEMYSSVGIGRVRMIRDDPFACQNYIYQIPR